MVELENDANLFPDSPYEYGGFKVPRVTHILHDMMHEESLIKWAYRMGTVKNDIDDIRNNAADKGSIVHSMCEYYLRYRLVPSLPDDINPKFKRECNNAFSGFLMWIDNINKSYYWRPLMIEQPLVCELFGGTMDALMEIGGKIYLIDFKTSNFLNFEYCLQVAAYRYMLRIIHGIEVDGCCVLRFDKKKKTFPEEMFFDMSDPIMKKFMDDCEAMFLNLAASYWYRVKMENTYKCITGKRF